LRFRDRTQLDVEGTSSLPSVSFVVVANGSPLGIIIVTPELACSTLALAVVPASITGIDLAMTFARDLHPRVRLRRLSQ
jgi:hypothetical protein